MKSNFLKRALLGFPLGVAIGYLLSIVFSVVYAGGYYGAVSPELIALFGSEINAVIIQAVLWGVIGFVFAGFSVVWEVEEWSYAKQTVVVFTAYIVTMTPIALLLRWIDISFISLFLFVAIFIAIFFFIWFAVYLKTRNDIKAINEKIKIS